MTDPNVKPDEASNSTSESLLARVQDNDATAWQRLVCLYTPLVNLWTRSASLQQADAADLRQEVFVAVARKIGDFQSDRVGATFRGWLYRITQHKLHDYWRKKRGDLAFLPDLDEMVAKPDDAVASRESQILYRRALELMKQDFEEATWRAFWRVVIDAQTPADVAQELKLTANAVYLAKARVLARLRAEFSGVIES